MKIPSLHQVVIEGRQSFARFPLVILNAIIGTAVTFVLIEHEGPEKASILFNILYATILGIPLLLAVALFVEKRQWSTLSSAAAQIAGIAVLVIYGSTAPSYLNDMPLFQLNRFLLFFAAAHCLAAVVPFAGEAGPNGAWRFAMVLLSRFFSSAFYSIVLMTGLSVGLAALEHLFGVTIPGKRYSEMTVLIIGIFNTWFFLSGVPREFEELGASNEYPKSLKIFSQYILVPLVLVYLVILYAYILKIVFLWSWPEGWVSRLIAGFSVTGMLTLLFLLPLREREEFRWVRALWQWFFVVLIPLAVLLPLAVYKRVSIYGMTESRCLGFVLAAWLAAMSVYFLFTKAKRIQTIPLSLCVVMILMGTGPWSIFSVSENDQVRRLKEVIVRNGILAGGSVNKTSAPVAVEDARRISGIISYLRNTHGYDKIQPWFRERLQSDTGSGIPNLKSPEAVTRLLGVEYAAAWTTGFESFLSLNANENSAVDIEGYDRVLGTFFIGKFGSARECAEEGVTFKPIMDGRQLEFVVESKEGRKEAVSVNVEELAARVVKFHGNTGVRNLPGDTLSATAQAAGRKIKVFFHMIQLERHEGKLVPANYSVIIALTKR